MKPKEKPVKKVIIRYKGNISNSSTERLRTESQKDLHKNPLKENKNNCKNLQIL